MNYSRIRRVLLLCLTIMWIASIILFFITKDPAATAEEAPLYYKVRAYVPAQNTAESALEHGKNMGFEGFITKGPRSVQQFMGYIAAHEYVASSSSINEQSIKDFLESKGFNPQLIPDEESDMIIIQIGDVFDNEKDARQLSEDARRHTAVPFKVRRHFKRASYTSIIVVFQDIEDREASYELREALKEFTPDVEVVSY